MVELIEPQEKASLFLALAPPPRLVARLTGLLDELRADTWTLRPTESTELHFVLHFLGPTPLRLVDDLKRELGAVCHARRPFDIEIGGLGCFPDDTEPRMLTLGLQDGAGKLGELSLAMRKVLNAYRLFPLGEAGLPRLALARVDRLSRGWDPRPLRGLAFQWKDVGPCPVEEVRLMKSRGTLAGGQRYEVLAALGLGGQV